MQLLVIGAGELGERAALVWRQRFPDAHIVCETRTTSKHERLAGKGFLPRIRSADRSQFPNVLMAIPPSFALDYEGEARRAISLWDGSGCACIISSTGVYAAEKGEWVDETSELGTSDRALRLIGAEKIFQAGGGTVLRLSGLYSQTKGPQIVYGRGGSSPARGDGWLNLIHYNDAASLTASIMEKKLKGVYLGTDDSPLTRRQLTTITGADFKFLDEETGLGKRCTNQTTRDAADWAPRWTSFAEWWALTFPKADV